LIIKWNQCLRERWVHPLIAMAASNLDFLCIHPFRDRNGRTSRLFLLLQCYHLGYYVGLYISLERLIEEKKDVIMKPLNRVPKAGMKGNTTHGPISIIYSLS